MPNTKFSVVSVNSGSTQSVEFGTRVINASVAVQGFNVSYGNTDHHLKTMDVSSAIAGISGSQVTVSATCFMEDKSNNKVSGTVRVLIIAECDS
ncbi:hypothetical protein [Pectobacterium versatile]|jgi:hypothetical protein|uniref:Uncharacterized protein n=1 Tax=Pectobacterium versatile TaxID=2488639 RepID=A0A221T5M5_9GAMM|nr:MULTISPECIES: hypothetical protein [Pectobacterium]ASN84209.1 Hypothetical protein SCC1_0738 [Pectobacterium versatile]AVT60247.1 hypothetical protein OA04_37650 [Pectobacterium versatile]AZK64135.1 hypothetical protein EIP93_18555 [Pectobacterium versatile]MBA0160040.1 hypothetical protein [Pectobacterium versatile]MBA0163157.1 hypothetical protein [Pectobacterium versatile]